ncbi:hypothetical protein VTL71DRAFT_15664 [Oculimacula yallundae]|uniref:2EXR domain-containing protein n=1 Tax=Oculimacula yallundae TaxID=86028 RepID=A0ABR4CH82_9HELO
MDQFSVFLRLPKDLRLLIWQFVASVPRIVEVHESHELIQDFEDITHHDFYGTPIQHPSNEAYSTAISSGTRPPILLSVCRESRAYGLTVYKQMDRGIRTTGSILETMFDIPIYVNPPVDIIFRHSNTCLIGSAFSVRCKQWIDHTQPMAATQTLAVDIAALSKLVTGRTNDYLRTEYRGGDENRLREELRRSKTNICKDIAACAAKVSAMSSLLWATMRTPRSASSSHFHPISSPRPQSEHDIKLPNVPLPSLSLMAVKRKPLKKFHLFSKLPLELQDMIWRQAQQQPRLLTLINVPDSDELFLPVVRQPALARVCRASRRLFLGQVDEPLHAIGNPTYFRPYRDTVRLEIWDEHVPKDFSKNCIWSLGIPYKYARKRTAVKFAAESKAFKYLREIVILLGSRRVEYEMELLPVDEDTVGMNRAELIETGDVRLFARSLRRELEHNSRKWKTYQKKRVAQGKISPDYRTPTVRIARMVAICENESPYEWEQHCPDAC